MRIFLMALGLLMFTGCGYKPSSHYIANVFAKTVYVEVAVDAIEPENAPFIKDEMNRLVYNRFKGQVTSKEKAESKIYVNYRGTSYVPLAYQDGYFTRYRADVRVNFKMETKEGIITKRIATRVESDIQASSLTSSNLRIEAIREGLSRALDEFMAYASAKGALVEAKKNKSSEGEKVN